MSDVPSPGVPALTLSRASRDRPAWNRFVASRGGVAGAVILGTLCALALAEPWWSGGSAFALSDTQFGPPSAAHWFGTDSHGRDLLSRVCYGARISLGAGIVGALVSLVIGAVWGATAGYLGGRWDAVLMRVVDTLYAMPSLVFVIVLMTAFEDLAGRWLGGDPEGWIRLSILFIGLGAVSWLNMARIVRGQVLSLRTRPFVEASRALGASHARIILRHILPNVAGIIVVYLALTVPSVVLYESFLSFLGLGVQAPRASLGSLLADGAAQINSVRVYWWMILFPGAGLVLALLALNFFADGLRDALDPRSGSR
jgi:oligopeptide transport system permease protein